MFMSIFKSSGGTWKMMIVFSLCLLLLSGVAFYNYFISKDNTQSELVTVQEPLETSYFEKISETDWTYIILLEDNNTKYEIGGGFLNAFDKDGYEQDVSSGDMLTIITDKEPQESNLRGSYYSVSSLSVGGKTYLSLEDTNEIRKSSKNFTLILGFVSLGAAIILIYVSIRKLKSIQKRANEIKDSRWDLPF